MSKTCLRLNRVKIRAGIRFAPTVVLTAHSSQLTARALELTDVMLQASSSMSTNLRRKQETTHFDFMAFEESNATFSSVIAMLKASV